MLRNRVMMVVGLLVLASMILAACAPKATPTPEPVVTTAPETPIEPVGRTGAWVDSIVYTEIPDANAAVTQLAANEIDIYAYGVGDPTLLRTVQENPELTYYMSYGGYNDFAFNVTTFTDTTKLNPFSNPKIREAMNWAIDRDYIAAEINGGLGTPKFLPMNSAFADYARYADLARQIEAKYAFDLERARAVVNEQMPAMGATLSAEGKWQYNGADVVLVFLIRIEDERKLMGEYFSTQLESLGFVVDRQLKSSRDAAAIWRSTAPTDGLWNIYTSGWISTAVSRDDSGNFGAFYTPLAYPYGYVQAYTPSEAFLDVCTKLWNNDFTNMEERRELFAQVMPLALEDSARVWIVDSTDFSPLRANAQVAYDLSGGIYGSRLYPYTVRYVGQEGGDMRIAMPTVLNDAWNPVGGSNFIYDTMIYRATDDVAVMPDPYTGLTWPQRISSAEIVVVEGKPISKTLDWIDLRFEPEIQVPADVWVDWDATNQRFITAAEKWPEGATAALKSTVIYEDGLWDIKWHDGSNLSPADFMLAMVMTFDVGKPESPIYDEAYVSGLEAFLSTFKGVRVVSTEPLVIETYSDSVGLDAETNVSSWWPNYGYGDAAWQMIVPGWKADAAGEMAFSSDKATVLEVEWTNYISGPSLDVLKKYLDEAAAEGFVPYANFMGQYLTAEEIQTRYANYQAWYAAKGHFWIGTGPFYLDQVYPVENQVVVKRNELYPDPSTKWAVFGSPKVSVVDVTGPAAVKIGEAATFDVSVTFEGAAYPANEISAVTYLLYNATGDLVGKGPATLVADGQYQVVLDAATTATLAAGANKLEVVVVSMLIGKPSFDQFEFVTAP